MTVGLKRTSISTALVTIPKSAYHTVSLDFVSIKSDMHACTPLKSHSEQHQSKKNVGFEVP